jgi:hypothetical protein
MKAKKILIVLAFLGLAGGGYVYYQWNRTNQSMTDAKEDLSIDSKALFDEFSANENLAMSKYIDKVILVRGVVSSIDKTNGQVAIMLGTGDPLGSVMCQLDPLTNQNVEDFKEGDQVKFRGKCAGFLTDVQLNSCVLVR